MRQLKSIHKHSTVIIIAVAIALVVGVVPSFILCDWTWFSRSGALLTSFGIFLIWLDYKEQINSDLNTVLNGFSEYLEKTVENESDRNRTKKIVSENFDLVRNATERRFKNIEFYLVISGTLIWAYGDLVGKFY